MPTPAQNRTPAARAPSTQCPNPRQLAALADELAHELVDLAEILGTWRSRSRTVRSRWTSRSRIYVMSASPAIWRLSGLDRDAFSPITHLT